jgi:MYXO-CTERM domain-containing protein
MVRSVILGVTSLTLASPLAMAQNFSVRAIHASPDAPAVNVLVNGGIAFPANPISFGQVSPTASLPAGTYDVGVAVAPGSTQIYGESFTLPAGASATIVAAGQLTPPAGGNAFDLIPFIDDNTQSPGAARIRFIHASPNTPAVSITLPDGSPLFSNVSYGTSGGYISVPGGTYNLQARTTVAGSPLTVELGAFTVTNNQVYSILAIGLFGGAGDQALRPLTVVDVVPAPGAAAGLALLGLAVARRRR